MNITHGFDDTSMDEFIELWHLHRMYAFEKNQFPPCSWMVLEE